MLTTAAARAATPGPRGYKLADAGGLHLFVAPSGTKSWRLKWRRAGREQLTTLGRFPALSLAEARARCQAAKAQIAAGEAPQGPKAPDTTASFEAIARAWHAHNLASWSPAHAADVLAGLERDVFPAIGTRDAVAIAPAELLDVVRAIEARGRAETARRLRQRLSAIFGYGVAVGLIDRPGFDPAAQLGRALGKSQPPRPQPALTRIEDCRALLVACAQAPARPAAILASRFLALTAVRLDAVRGMRWCEVEDLDGPEPLWRVPPARMKLSRSKKGEDRFAHLVPLNAPAVAVLRDANMHFGNANMHDLIFANMHDLIFPGAGGDAPIGENALRELYAAAGFAGRHVPHGWRSAFSTILNLELGADWSIEIERALAHVDKDKVKAAYDRAGRDAAQLARRRALFDRWGQLLTA